jgi:hypothetical protein
MQEQSGNCIRTFWKILSSSLGAPAYLPIYRSNSTGTKPPGRRTESPGHNMATGKSFAAMFLAQSL